MNVEQIYTGCLAQGAYYIESAGEAVIIDPLRETGPYLKKLAETGARLKYIFETHFHADFVSGHLDLARETGAQIVYGPLADPDYAIYSAADGEALRVGELTFVVLHTPGHTMESSTFLLRDASGKDYALFTGDTLFLGDVGRPDLAIKQGEVTKEDLAGYLFNSLRGKIMPLADDVLVYPAHGAGSACGKNLSKETFGRLGDQKRTNYALRADMTREEFVREVTAGLTPPPQYFAKNAQMNKGGYDRFDEVLGRGNRALTADKFEQLAESEDALILDVRDRADFAAGFIPNSIFIGIDGQFAPWVGALIVDIKQPILIVAPAGREEEVVTRLSRVGYDTTLGYLDGGIAAWRAAGREVDTIETISATEFATRVERGGVDHILDTRKPTEFLSEHLEAGENFPLDYINGSRMQELDREETYYLHCGSGYRSLIAASILQARGYRHLVNVEGGWSAIKDTDLPKTAYTCPTKIDQQAVDRAVIAVL
ncbi:glyoxylase-like metal-dependent hydrolase (beta-lactamase superfamily II) [Neolewinella xylanilytica]|uniref:Glyoxylase-like metal-dependent hydrolase (Beta-lactamase superfamily II) n=1 Tax=Neolewinella xylanilytica TaxID=1514080 RepID=A0A2S6IA17_9BACT|nr:MBL fold metallo-hydrolase [Neolewinella xylanilytica]PPK88344.1 glyoxylase-like metal-dependent hydrolase (beta-lactamase superfamily II) [Neolewinella xylanilytica]